jgi:hypothetical protein
MNLENLKEWTKENELVDLSLDELAEIVEIEPTNEQDLLLLGEARYAYLYKLNEHKINLFKKEKLKQTIESYEQIKNSMDKLIEEKKQQLAEVEDLLHAYSADARYAIRYFVKELELYNVKDVELITATTLHSCNLAEIQGIKEAIESLEEKLSERKEREELLRKIIEEKIKENKKRINTVFASYSYSNTKTRSYKLKKGVTAETLPEKYVKTKTSVSVNMELIKKNYATDEALKEFVQMEEKPRGLSVKKVNLK